MRRDMPKLLVCTSRHGGRKNDDVLRLRREKVRVAKVTRWEAVYDDDGDGPFLSESEDWEQLSGDDEKVASRGKVGMRQRRYSAKHWRKEFGENLAPLVSFLRSNVGRPWDKVYSEIREVCEPTGTVNAHIYQHLWSYVVKDVVLVDGKPWERAGAPYGSERPLTRYGEGAYKGFYVHPVTGLLLRAPRAKRRVFVPEDKRSYENVRFLPERTLIRRVDDVGAATWFEVELEVQAERVKLSPESLSAMLVEKGFARRDAELVVRVLVNRRKGPETGVRLKGPISVAEAEAA